MNPFVAIPIKPFGVAKARLSPVLDATQRSRLGKTIAGHTIQVAQAAGAPVAVVTGDEGVAVWAASCGTEVIWEAPQYGEGLNGAAAAAAARAAELGAAWVILHADLPLITPLDLKAAFDEFDPGGFVLAPSYDGGTSLFMGEGPFPFSYGAASFHRHLAAAAGRAAVVVRTGLALDLDTPRDLEATSLGPFETRHRIPG